MEKGSIHKTKERSQKGSWRWQHFSKTKNQTNHMESWKKSTAGRMRL